MTDLITLPRATVQQALEALEFMADEWGFTQKANRPERWQAIEALKAALEQPEQEPVAWVEKDGELVWCDKARATGRNLYTHPPRRERRGLSEELDRLWREPMSADWEHREFARAVEAAHGIKEEK